MQKPQEVAKHFGKYQIYQSLTLGGMAELFLAKQVGVGGFERSVVIKCILPQFAQDPQFVTMFLDEARIASLLNHPNIVQLYEIGEENGTYYIAMEYIRGPNFKTLRKTLCDHYTTPPYGLIAGIVAQGAAGLHYAHKAHDEYGNPLAIVHRDVSPTNLLLSYEGSVKLVDFGVAKATVQEHKTTAGMIKGKYLYMSPEQILGEPVDHRSDIFALGSILYELTTGIILFKRRTEAETIQAVHQEPIVPPHAIINDFPEELDRIIMKALTRDRDERYQTAEEMQQDLSAFMLEQDTFYGPKEIAEELRGIFTQLFEVHDKAIQERAKQIKKETGSFAHPLHTTGSFSGFSQSGTPTGASTSSTPFGTSTPMPVVVPELKDAPSYPTGAGLSWDEIPSEPLSVSFSNQSGSMGSGLGHSNSQSYSSYERSSMSSFTFETPSTSRPWLTATAILLILIITGVVGYAAWNGFFPSKPPYAKKLLTVEKLLDEGEHSQAIFLLRNIDPNDLSPDFKSKFDKLVGRVTTVTHLAKVKGYLYQDQYEAAFVYLKQLRKRFPNNLEYLNSLQKVEAKLKSQGKDLKTIEKTKKAPVIKVVIPAPPPKRRVRKKRRRRRYRRVKRRKRAKPKPPVRRVEPVVIKKKVEPPAIGTVYVTGEPANARVEVDGKLFGYTPINGKKLKSGAHTISVSKPKYFPFKKTFILKTGSIEEVKFILKSKIPPRPRIVRKPVRRPKVIPVVAPTPRRVVKKKTPVKKFSSSRIPRGSKTIRIFIAMKSGLGGNTYTSQFADHCRKIERDVARLLGHRYSTKNITRPLQRYVRKRATLTGRERFTFYPRALAYVIYMQLKRGRSKRRVSQLLVSYQKRRKFRRYRNR